MCTLRPGACAAAVLSLPLLVASVEAHAEATGGSVTLQCPRVMVRGYPFIVVVTLDNTSLADPENLPIVVARQDLTCDQPEGIGLAFVLRTAEGKEYRVGDHEFGLMGSEWMVSDRGKNIVIAQGQRVSLTFDLAQMETDRWRGLPASGECTIAAWVRHSDPVIRSADQAVLVRLPTDEEKRVARSLETQIRNVLEAGDRGWPTRSWFPNAVLAAGEVPASSGLPVESRRPIKLVRILRSALVSPNDTLEVMSRTKLDWGYLGPFIETLRYECLLAAGDEQGAATARATTLQRELGDGHIALVDIDVGLLATCLKLKQDMARREARIEELTGRRGQKPPAREGASASGEASAESIAESATPSTPEEDSPAGAAARHEAIGSGGSDSDETELPIGYVAGIAGAIALAIALAVILVRKRM
jgi:hypothetical protein